MLVTFLKPINLGDGLIQIGQTREVTPIMYRNLFRQGIAYEAGNELERDYLRLDNRYAKLALERYHSRDEGRKEFLTKQIREVLNEVEPIETAYFAQQEERRVSNG